MASASGTYLVARIEIDGATVVITATIQAPPPPPKLALRLYPQPDGCDVLSIESYRRRAA